MTQKNYIPKNFIGDFVLGKKKDFLPIHVTLANLSHRCLGILKNKSSSLVLSLWRRCRGNIAHIYLAPLKRVSKVNACFLFFFCGDAMFNLNAGFCCNPWYVQVWMRYSMIFRVPVLKSRESWTWGCSYTCHRKLHSASPFAKKRVSCFWKNLSNRRHLYGLCIYSS